MNRRLITFALAATLLVPVMALADASSDGLGPTTAQDSGGSSADASALQPAGAGSVQPNVNSSGLTGSTGDAATLQQPATTDNTNLQVLLNGDQDGSPQNPQAGISIWWYVLSGLLGLGIVALGIWIWNRRSASPLVISAEPADSEQESDSDKSESATDEPLAPTDGTESTTEAETVEAEPESVVADENAQTTPKADADVQNDKTVPPIVSDSSNKTGDDSGQHPQHNRKKGRKHGKNRSKH